MKAPLESARLSPMKKLASIFVAVGSLAIAAPVFACPHEEAEKTDANAPRTAEKDKAKEQPKAEKAKEAPAPAKAADKSKPADKVSAK